MSKVKGPLYSLGAQKSIGKSITYKKVRGRVVAQKFFTPTDKKTADQLSIRNTMKELQTIWSGLTATQKDAWKNYAKKGLRGKIPGYNAFLKHNFIKYHDTGLYDPWPNYNLNMIYSTGEKLTDSAGNRFVVNMGD